MAEASARRVQNPVLHNPFDGSVGSLDPTGARRLGRLRAVSGDFHRDVTWKADLRAPSLWPPHSDRREYDSEPNRVNRQLIAGSAKSLPQSGDRVPAPMGAIGSPTVAGAARDRA